MIYLVFTYIWFFQADFNNTSLSVALDQRLEEGTGGGARGPGGRSWQQRLLVTGANAQYTRRRTLSNITAIFDKYVTCT